MKKVDTDALDPALESDSEKIHRGARIALGLFPGIGSVLVEIFGSAVESPLTKRRWQTMIQLGEVINDLLERGVVTEAGLQENDAFISTVAEVCAISLRNHQSEKLDALRNAVRNSALPTCPADDYRQIFLNFVDQCTVSHIKVLQFANDPMLWFKNTGIGFPGYKSGDIFRVIDTAIPELNGHPELRKFIWDDLVDRGLLTPHLTLESKGPQDSFDKKTTTMGADLVRFIG